MNFVTRNGIKVEKKEDKIEAGCNNVSLSLHLNMDPKIYGECSMIIWVHGDFSRGIVRNLISAIKEGHNPKHLDDFLISLFSLSYYCPL